MSLCLRISYASEPGTPTQLSVSSSEESDAAWPSFFRLPTVRRQIIIFPFEVAIALWCAYSGVTGLLGIGLAADALYLALGSVATVFNAGYVLAGISMYFGVALTRRNIEAFGLILVISSLLTRTIALMWVAGMSSMLLNQYVLNGLIFLASLARLISLWRHYYVIEISAKHDDSR